MNQARRNWKKWAFVACAALVGAATLLATRAAAPTAHFEAEQASRGTSRATVASDVTASNGQYVQFNAPASNSPSGQSMPVGDLPGWRQIFTDDFTTNVSVGNFPGSAYGAKWDAYNDGWNDTSAQPHVDGAPSRYYPSRVVSVQNGVLNKYLHTENIGGVQRPLVAALVPKIPGGTSRFQGQLYGRYIARVRSDALQGYKTAWLLWPDTDNWNEGEIDFPEGNLNETIGGFNHCANIGNPQRNCAQVHTQARYTDWHTVTIEWTPGRVRFYLDGNEILNTTDSIPNTPMHWVLQTETCFSNCQPAASTAGNLQVDWVAMYARN